MTRRQSWCWGLALGTVATLNILDVLPDWITISAVLALAVMACPRCLRAGAGAR